MQLFPNIGFLIISHEYGRTDLTEYEYIKYTYALYATVKYYSNLTSNFVRKINSCGRR